MAEFYVGQRVRIKRTFTPMGSRFLGMEATITEARDFQEETRWGLDIFPIHRMDGYLWAWRSVQLEPITDANNLVSWESCAWMPEHLREKA